ncbi:MAG: hypothetical protein WDO56_35045 [Gammaproteobacteria bacterium]
MSQRLDELAMRRRKLLLHSERLRADLAADQRVMLEALSGVDRAYAVAKRAAAPLLMVGAGALLFRLLRRSRPGRGAGLTMKALFWVSMAQKALPYAGLVRNLWRSRSARRAEGGAEDEQGR